MSCIERVRRSPGERLLLCAWGDTKRLSFANDVRDGRLTSQRRHDIAYIIVHGDRRDGVR